MTEGSSHEHTDAIITETAALHVTVWKELCDHYLKARAEYEHVLIHPFDAETDYRQYVDGTSRDDGHYSSPMRVSATWCSPATTCAIRVKSICSGVSVAVWYWG